MQLLNRYSWDIKVDHIPPIFTRTSHALIAITDHLNRVYLGQKHIYPAGIYRLIGGGIEKNEDPALGACREVSEETGLELIPSDLDIVTNVYTLFKDTFSDDQYDFTSFIYHYRLKSGQTLKPSSDLNGIIPLSKQHLYQLIETYKRLPSDLIALDQEGKAPFRWSDYGAYYSRIHQLIYDYL